jgi:hypothetical protein
MCDPNYQKFEAEYKEKIKEQSKKVAEYTKNNPEVWNDFFRG